MKCDKTILAPMLQLIHFGKTNDMVPSTLTTEFGEWMKYYEIKMGPMVWDQFKEIETLPSTSNGFKLNSRNLEPMDPTPIKIQRRYKTIRRPISYSIETPVKKVAAAKPMEAVAPKSAVDRPAMQSIYETTISRLLPTLDADLVNRKRSHVLPIKMVSTATVPKRLHLPMTSGYALGRIQPISDVSTSQADWYSAKTPSVRTKALPKMTGAMTNDDTTEPMDPRPVAVEVTTIAQPISISSESPEKRRSARSGAGKRKSAPISTINRPVEKKPGASVPRPSKEKATKVAKADSSTPIVAKKVGKSLAI